MTPEEKANELMSKYVGISLSQVDQLVDGIRIRLAKECALIAVDEIDKAIDFDWMEIQNLDRQHDYWQQVREEIEKL
jgi:hypothetical protein